jgi:hypothetical protein
MLIIRELGMEQVHDDELGMVVGMVVEPLLDGLPKIYIGIGIHI